MSARVAVVGDLHIGAPVRQLDLHASATVSEKKLRDFAYYATERLIETVSSAKPDAVLITGDLFDRSDASPRALDLALGMLTEWCQGSRPVIIIGGNHDAESELPLLLQAQLPTSARWLSSTQPETVLLPKLGLAVHGVSVCESDDLRNVVDDYPAPVDGACNIAMLHSSLDGEWSGRVCLPVPLERLRNDNRYDAWALGHVHRRLQLGEHPAIAYPGGVHAKREDAHGSRGFAMLECDSAVPRERVRITEVDVELNPSNFPW